MWRQTQQRDGSAECTSIELSELLLASSKLGHDIGRVFPAQPLMGEQHHFFEMKSR